MQSPFGMAGPGETASTAAHEKKQSSSGPKLLGKRPSKWGNSVRLLLGPAASTNATLNAPHHGGTRQKKTSQTNRTDMQSSFEMAGPGKTAATLNAPHHGGTRQKKNL